MPELTAERLKTVVTAWHRSLREQMEIGENALIAWRAVPDLADEVERLHRENTRLSEDLRSALREVADHA